MGGLAGARVAIVPAKGTSRRFPRKNLEPFRGKPLFAYAVEAAQNAKLFDLVLVSSDDDEILTVAASYGATAYRRPAELCGDMARLTDVCLNVLDDLERQGADYAEFCLLQPVCPLRTADDVVRSYELLVSRKANYVLSVCEYEEPPFWALRENEEGFLSMVWGPEYLTVRQEVPRVVKHNGAIVWGRTAVFRAEREFLAGSRVVGYVMPPERSVDIDTPIQLKWAEWLHSRRGGS